MVPISDTPTKKKQILSPYESGMKDIAEIARQVRARPSHVVDVLRRAGHIGDHFDLYAVSYEERNLYGRYFRNVLDLKDEDAARKSCVRLTRLYNYCERLGDRMGQHHACVAALTGKNRARWSGKLEESEVFEQWLASH